MGRFGEGGEDKSYWKTNQIFRNGRIASGGVYCFGTLNGKLECILPALLLTDAVRIQIDISRVTVELAY